MGQDSQVEKRGVSSDNPKVVCQMTITHFENGNTSVNGFPLNAGEAIEMLALAIKAITDYFINAAIDGKIKREEKIIAPNLNDIIKLN